jgi:hypothetical protein
MNESEHHEGEAEIVTPTTIETARSRHVLSSNRPTPSPLSRLKKYIYDRTIMGRGLMWAHVGTHRFLVKRDEDE